MGRSGGSAVTAIAHGFLGATELFTQSLNLTSSYQLFTLNFAGIDSWTLTNQQANTLIDDITLNDPVGTVPEAASLAIWERHNYWWAGTGLGEASPGRGMQRLRLLSRCQIGHRPIHSRSTAPLLSMLADAGSGASGCADAHSYLRCTRSHLLP